MRYTSAFIMVSMLALRPASAADVDKILSKKFDSCMDKSNGITSKMIDCIVDETKVQDSKLNAAYRKLTTQVSSGRKKQLLDAQRLWLQFREKNCAFQTDPDGGTNAIIIGNDCFLQATATRAKELEDLTIMEGAKQ